MSPPFHYGFTFRFLRRRRSFLSCILSPLSLSSEVVSLLMWLSFSCLCHLLSILDSMNDTDSLEKLTLTSHPLKKTVAEMNISCCVVSYDS
jgi:hypothetical protein